MPRKFEITIPLTFTIDTEDDTITSEKLYSDVMSDLQHSKEAADTLLNILMTDGDWVVSPTGVEVHEIACDTSESVAGT